MRKTNFISVTVCCIIIISVTYAQKKKANNFTKEDIEKTTFLIPLNKNYPEYSLYLKECVEKIWTFNEFKFINEEDLLPYLKDSKYSAIVFSTIRTAADYSSPNAKEKTFSNVRFSIVKGKPGFTIMVNQILTPEFEEQIAVSVNLPTPKVLYKGDEYPLQYEYKPYLLLIISELQNLLVDLDSPQTKLISKKEDKKHEKLNDLRKIEIRDSLLANCNILVCQSFLDNINKTVLAEMYKVDPNKIFIVDEEDIMTALETEDKNVLIGFKKPVETFPLSKNAQLYRAENRKGVYQPNYKYEKRKTETIFFGITATVFAVLIVIILF